MLIINTPDPPDVEQTKLMIRRQIDPRYSGEVIFEPEKKKPYSYKKNWTCKVFVDQHKIHREKYPAYILYRNKIIERESYLEDNNYHRDVGPASLYYAGYGSKVILNEQYYNHGLLHRLDGPAAIYYKLDLKKPKFPATRISQQHYYVNGYRHRLDGPALIQACDIDTQGMECYYFNGQLHSENGLAEKWFNERGICTYESYALYGKKMSKEEFDKKMLTKLYW